MQWAKSPWAWQDAMSEAGVKERGPRRPVLQQPLPASRKLLPHVQGARASPRAIARHFERAYLHALAAALHTARLHSMADDDRGSLPQRPPRQPRRMAPATEAEPAAPSGEDASEPPADERSDAAADSGPAAYAPPVGPSLEYISDKHTSTALRSAKVDGYDFECKPAMQDLRP